MGRAAWKVPAADTLSAQTSNVLQSRRNMNNKDNNFLRSRRLMQWIVLLTVITLSAAVGFFIDQLNPNSSSRLDKVSDDPTSSSSDVQHNSSLVARDFETTLEWIRSELASMPKEQGYGIVNFWATWCAPCRTEMPELVKLKKDADRTVLLISGDNTSDRALVTQFLEESSFFSDSSIVAGDQDLFLSQWRQYTDATPAKGWALSLPATYILDRNAQPVRLIVGQTTFEQLNEILNELEAQSKQAQQGVGRSELN